MSSRKRARAAGSGGRSRKRGKREYFRAKRRSPYAGVVARSMGALKKSPFEPVKYVTLRYSQLVTLDAGAGTMAYTVFRANSLVDPDYSGTGHQPLGRDELASVYRNYSVYEATITAEFADVGYSYVCALGLNNSPVTTPPATASAAIESFQYTTKSSSYRNTNNTVVSHKYNAANWHGDKNIVDDPQQVAGMESSPANSEAFYVGVGSFDQSTDLPAVQAMVTITYKCKLTVPIQLVQS